MWGMRADYSHAHFHQTAPYTVILQPRHGLTHAHSCENGQRHAHPISEQACGAGYALPLRHPRCHAEQDKAANIRGGVKLVTAPS